LRLETIVSLFLAFQDPFVGLRPSLFPPSLTRTGLLAFRNSGQNSHNRQENSPSGVIAFDFPLDSRTCRTSGHLLTFFFLLFAFLLLGLSPLLFSFIWVLLFSDLLNCFFPYFLASVFPPPCCLFESSMALVPPLFPLLFFKFPYLRQRASGNGFCF